MSDFDSTQMQKKAIALLCDLIKIESFSTTEDKTAERIVDYLKGERIVPQRSGNNVWVKNRFFDEEKPTILLNSHHDTVKPNGGYTKDPFSPEITEGKLYGLGSNDAGGCLVSLISTFCYFYEREELPYNLILAASAEEENSGKNGVESILPLFGAIDFGIVGEPTEMRMAVAEKGLLVLDCIARGKSGHAARDLGLNAIYESFEDLSWFRDHRFPKISDHLGEVKMSVTMIKSGYQHNVIPDACEYVVDVRTTDKYSNQEVLEIIQKSIKSDVKARSTRLNSSFLPPEHPMHQSAKNLAIEKFGSPTTSDQAVMAFPTFKMGPGKSERSHTADEYIFIQEIENGIVGYVQLLEDFFTLMKNTES